MEKSKIYKKLEDLKAKMHEPVATYGKPSETVQDVVADYVWEDVRAVQTRGVQKCGRVSEEVWKVNIICLSLLGLNRDWMLF